MMILLELSICEWILVAICYIRNDILVSSLFLLFYLPPRYNYNIVESGVKHHTPLFCFKLLVANNR
jgi:hypothetical protein